MKINKFLSKLTFLSLTILLTFAVSAEAQKKKPVTKKPTTTTTTTTTNTFEIRDEAGKVATQIKNVASFIYRLGGIATGIEDLDKQAKSGKLSKAEVDKNAQFKQAVIQSIVNLKAGLAALESDFRTKNSIKPYLFQIQGVTDLAMQSEDLARAGKFTDSGKALIGVVDKLADTLAAMP
jgi:hypothetical protein